MSLDITDSNEAIVVNDRNKAIVVASGSESFATQFAERAAAIRPGETFAVYTRKTARIADAAITIREAA